MSKNIRTAVILCGGKGTRLGSLSKKIPKSLVKIQNKEILWYIINILKINKFNHFILPIGYKGKLIKNFIKKKFKNKSKIEFLILDKILRLHQEFLRLKKYIKSDNFLLLNGDAIFNFDINNIYKKHVLRKVKMTFISFSFQAYFGTISIKKNKVIGFQINLNFNYVGTKNQKTLDLTYIVVFHY